MDVIIQEIIQVIHKTHGFDVSIYDETFLQKSIINRSKATGWDGLSDYLLFLSANRLEAEILFKSLSITYTDFFRNALAFANLEHWILPKLLKDKSPGSEIRVWSAGCASGQETYSIAMLLSKLHHPQGLNVNYRILGTDISQISLVQAIRGEYKEEAMQNIPLKHIKEFFTQNGDTYKIIPKLKQHISFSTYDLLDSQSNNPPESIFGDYDLIFCSNLLYYYRPEQQLFILRKIFRALAEQGYLILGETERYIMKKTSGLQMVAQPATIYQKRRSD
jgi:chemotaxis protein methyltransferase CheR